MSDSVWPHGRQPIRLLCPWDSPGKNTGLGCHFLLQCMKVKSESEVAQSCLTLSNPMDCSLPGSSIQGIFQARVLEWGAIAFSEGNPLVVHLLGLCASNAGGTGSIPGQGTKISHALRHLQKKKRGCIFIVKRLFYTRHNAESFKKGNISCSTICYRKCCFSIRIILSWRQMRSSRYKKSPLVPPTGLIWKDGFPIPLPGHRERSSDLHKTEPDLPWRHVWAVFCFEDRGSGCSRPGRHGIWHMSSWRRSPLASL